ncbi:MAG: VWA domain-containing protein [Candidatus Acidiferrum sp.]
MQHLFVARRVFYFLGISAVLVVCAALHAQNPPAESPASAAVPVAHEEKSQPDSAQAPSAQAPANNSELSSQDHPATFKVRVNLVLVRVVVRDEQGKVVPNLRKEDFQLLDDRKPQLITAFSLETPESLALKPAVVAGEDADASEDKDAGEAAATAAAVKLPQRFVALLFDDAHLSMEDSTFVRTAATKLFAALAPSDRVGIFTTSGQVKVPFTADREALGKSLLSIVPRAQISSQGFQDCPDISYYQAVLIENRRDSQALAAAAEDTVQCQFGGDESKAQQAAIQAQAQAAHVLNNGDRETEYAYRHIEEAMQSLSRRPGRRIMVFVSPGFIPSSLWPETSEMIDRANRSGIVINTIDARGLYTSDVLGDIANPSRDSAKTAGFKASYRVQAQSEQNRVLDDFASGTGGTFFHNRNDVDEGLREAVAAPPLSYLLGFSPQNMKVDGHFHNLKVTLSNKRKYLLEVRRGYYAPRSITNPVEAAKREIQEAIFSQEEIHDVPVDLQTQFFKKDAATARLSVLSHFDLKGIHFHKVEGRNHDNLTIATAIFDENGNFVTGGEKTVQMKLLDSTYTRLSRSGLTLKSSYDVKPGSYMVRLVVRDSEGSQMAARNGAVVIPN